MAEVQLALQRGPAGFEKLVVVKLVHANLATQKAFVDMLLDEARVAALVKHPNVVDIYDLGEVEGRYFIAMEYLEGEPLLAVLRAGRDGERLDVLSTGRLIADTAEGLDAAHELRSMAGDPIGLVHHDVSLGNIVVLYNGQVKLVDFGVAKATQSTTGRTRVQGKFGYMAPEKLRGDAGDRRSDIWSLGCVLWEALTLRRLFKGATDTDTMQQVLSSPILAPSQVNGDVPADFDPIVMRSLDRDPSKRYPTAKAMAAELEEVLRKHGYAAKNDTIAKYMQATFQDHIKARKKLLQEVSSKGGASPDVLEAAFNDGALASGSPILSTGEFKRIPPSPALAEHTPDRMSARRAIPFPRTTAEELARLAVTSTPPAQLVVLPTLPAQLAVFPAPPAQGAAGESPLVQAPSAVPSRRWILYACLACLGGAGVVLAGVIAASVRGGGSGTEMVIKPDHKPDHATTTVGWPDPQPPPLGPTERPAAPPLAGPAQPVDIAPVLVPVGEQHRDAAPHRAPSEPSSMAGTSTRAVPVRHVHAPRSAQPTKVAANKINPDETFKAGLQAWVRGDTRTALASYKRVLQAKPTYAAAWRGVGLVYEKLGDKAAARAAFQKYLHLAPGASDAAGIRARLAPR
jgi:serine/threonine-protein kinase